MIARGRRASDVILAAILLLLIGLTTYSFFQMNARSHRLERRADHLDRSLAASHSDLRVSTAQTRRMIEQVVRKGLKPAVSSSEIPEVGPPGPQGTQGVQGLQGIPGLAGRGVSSVQLDGCTLVITYTSGAVSRLGPVCGPPGAVGTPGSPGAGGKDGTDGQPGPAGKDGKDGTNGTDGRGITSIVLRCDDNPGTPLPGDGTVTFAFTFTDGTTQDVASTTECRTS